MEWLDNLRAGVRSADEKATNALRYYMGPAYAPVNALANVAAMVSPGEDFMDMYKQGNALMQSRTPRSAGMNALGLGAATLGMAIPGSASGIRNATEEAVDGARKGIRAYHGSPHDFDAFDTSKIGTGEGAQAYGHGLYFAENEGVARSYRDSLAGRMNAEERRAALSGKDHVVSAVRMMRQDGMEKDAVRDILKKTYKNEPDQVIDAAMVSGDPGKMYEVNINADPADFLDWDAPLSAQKAKGVYVAHNPDITGRDAVQGLAARLGSKDKVPEYLSGRGIPGIKYLDAGSRGAGDGSRNYVVFDPATIEILKKYGLLGAVGGGMGANALAGGQPDEL